jgi:hypothetical protein
MVLLHVHKAQWPLHTHNSGLILFTAPLETLSEEAQFIEVIGHT